MAKGYISSSHVGLLRFFMVICILLLESVDETYSSTPDPPQDRSCSDLTNSMDGNFICSNNNNHDSTCRFECSRTGFSPCPGSPTSWTCDNGDWRGNPGLPSCCDTAAPSVTCPSSKTVYAGRNTVHARISWDSPEVSDNSMETIQPVRTSGSPPGSWFEEGRHAIAYSATDAAGNTRTCTFSVEVNVHRCEALRPSNNQRMFCTNNGASIHGTNCTFSCTAGWCLDGMSSMTCEYAGMGMYQWTADKPESKAISCPRLTPPLNGRIVGTCNNTYRAQCELGCNPGYTMDGESSLRQLQCRSLASSSSPCLGIWIGQIPTCTVVDTEPPAFDEPDRIVLYAERGSYSAAVSFDWEPIMANDVVSGDIISNLITIDGMPLLTGERPSSFREGVHRLVYEAVDEAGNSELLTIELIVEVLRCAIISSNQQQSHACTAGNIFGSVCTFHCPPHLCLEDVMTITCNNIGSSTHPAADWSDQQPSCQFIHCTVLMAPLHGHIVDGSCPTSVGSRCLIGCDSGYSLHDGNLHYVRRCQGSAGDTCDSSIGNWSGEQPSCEVISDTDAPVFPNTRQITVYAGIRTIQAELDYSWEPVIAIDEISGEIEARLVSVNTQSLGPGNNRPRYLTEGRHTLEYMAVDDSGNEAVWTLEVIVEVTRCPEMNIVSFGDVSCSHGSIYGSTCTLKCFVGRCPTGNDVISCQNTGLWDSDIGVCQPIHCLHLELPSNSHIMGTCSRTYDSHCVLECNSGYGMDGDATSETLQCQADASSPSPCIGVWLGERPSCTDIEAPIFPPSVLTARLDITPGDSHAYVTYSYWEPIEAFDTVSGVITASLFSIGSNIIQDGVKPNYLHEGTFTLVYEAVDEAGNRATWSMTLQVRAARCPDLEPMQHGQISCESDEYTIGTSCSIQCDIGYCPADEIATLACVAGAGVDSVLGGHWDVSQPTCQYIRCPELLVPINGFIASGTCSTTIGSICEVACDSGYQISGESVRMCETREGAPSCQSASWSGEPPACQANTCPSLQEVFPAFHTGCNKAPETDVVGASCQWHCPPGYTTEGQDTSNCLADGSWDNVDFACKASCQALNMPSIVKVTPANCNIHPSLVDDSCQLRCRGSGFELRDSVGETVHDSSIVCNVDGQWGWNDYIPPFGCVDIESPTFIECARTRTIYALRSSLMADAAWNTVATDNSGDDPVISCNFPPIFEDQLSEGVHSVRCSATDEEGNEARCDSDVTILVHRCQPVVPPLTNNGLVDESRYPCENHWGGNCSIACDSEYELEGNSVAVCEYDAVFAYWSWGNILPLCVPKDTSGCPSIEASFETSIVADEIAYFCSSSTRIGSICTLYCLRSGFELAGGNVHILCQTDRTWNVDLTAQQLHCLDTVPPTLSGCPSQAIDAELSPITLLAEVYFSIPEANDNSDLPLRVETTPTDITSPYSFSASTLAKYRFIDEAGNDATCSFQVNVQNNLPPVVTCPEDLMFDTPNDVMWQIPEFKNPVTDQDIVPWCNRSIDDTFVPGTQLISCTATNPDNGFEASCVFGITVAGYCNHLPHPEYGTLVCMDNYICNIVCDQGYSVRPGQPTEFTCGDSGWQPTDVVSDCQANPRPFRMQVAIDMKYDCMGNCNEDETKTEVVAQAVRFVESVKDIGPCSDLCSSDAIVTFQEGISSRRRKRSHHSLMTLCITLKVPVNETATAEDIDTEINEMTKLGKLVVVDLEENNLHLHVQDTLFEQVEDEVEMRDAVGLCKDGYTPDAEDPLSCIPCETTNEGETSCESDPTMPSK